MVPGCSASVPAVHGYIAHCLVIGLGDPLAGPPGLCRIAWLARFSAVLFQGIDRPTRRKQPLWLLPQFAVPSPAESNHMEANADSFLELIHQFEDFTDAVSPEQAHSEFDETTLQIFWMRWPQLSAWTGSLWRMLSEEMSGPSAPHTDPELDEVGESG